MAKASTRKTTKGKPVKMASRSASKKSADSIAKQTTKSRPAAVKSLAGKSAAPKAVDKKKLKSRPALVEAKASKNVAKPMSSAKSVNHAPPVIIPSPVPTDGKPRKNQAGLSVKELEQFRELLLAKRRELVGDMSSMEREALRSTTGTNLSNLPMHMADMGTDNYEQEFTLGLVEKDRQLLREINSALAKIQNGTYGICEGTGKPISKTRLDAQPWAKYSIEHARQLEKAGGFRR